MGRGTVHKETEHKEDEKSKEGGEKRRKRLVIEAACKRGVEKEEGKRIIK